MSVPAEAVAGAVFKMRSEESRVGEEVAVARLLEGLVYSVALVDATVAVLTIGPCAAGLMCTVMVKGWVALGASVPKVQVTVPAVLVHASIGVTKRTCTGSTSVTVPPLEVEGPTLVTVRV